VTHPSQSPDDRAIGERPRSGLGKTSGLGRLWQKLVAGVLWMRRHVTRRALCALLFTFAPMPVIFLLITETELRPSMRLLDVQQDCKGEVAGTILIEPRDGDDVDITVIFDQWFTVRSTCHYIEFSPPGSISMFRYAPYSVLSYRGSSPEEAMVGVIDFSDYSAHVKQSFHNGAADIFYYLVDLDDFGGVLRFRWKDALKRTSFTQKQLLLEPTASPTEYAAPVPSPANKTIGDFVKVHRFKTVRARLTTPDGYTFAQGLSAPTPTAYHRPYVNDEFDFDLRDSTASWQFSSDLHAVFESNTRKTMRDVLLIILSAIVGLGLAILSEKTPTA
jgi:hypothetical protein